MLEAKAYKRGLNGDRFSPEKLPLGHLYGENLRSRHVPGLILSERRYSPDFRTPKHSHEQALFCLVIQGAYTETVGAKTRQCEASLLLFHPAGEQHEEHFHSCGGRSFIIEIEPWWLDRIREHTVIIDRSADFHGGDPALLGMKLYNEFLHAEDDVSQLVIEGLMLAILGEATRGATTPVAPVPPRWLGQAKDLLHDRFTESLTLADIAQSVGVHPVHLAQTFHKYFKCTVGTYLRQLRVDFACQQLVNSDAPLCQIALAAGFTDQSHFTRMFKRYVGVTPGQYRELHTEPKPVP